LQKIQSASTQVDDLKEKLKAQEVEVNLKNEEASKLIQIVGTEKEKVDKEKAVADEEERKVSKIQEDVSAKKEDCERDLSKAMPALEAAKAALDTLNKVHTRFENCSHFIDYVHLDTSQTLQVAHFIGPSLPFLDHCVIKSDLSRY